MALQEGVGGMYPLPVQGMKIFANGAVKDPFLAQIFS